MIPLSWKGYFWVWRVNFRREVSSGASRPTEAMMWISEIESAKSITGLKTSETNNLCEIADKLS